MDYYLRAKAIVPGQKSTLQQDGHWVEMCVHMSTCVVPIQETYVDNLHYVVMVGVHGISLGLYRNRTRTRNTRRVRSGWNVAYSSCVLVLD
jgi:hypothetical protein